MTAEDLSSYPYKECIACRNNGRKIPELKKRVVSNSGMKSTNILSDVSLVAAPYKKERFLTTVGSVERICRLR